MLSKIGITPKGFSTKAFCQAKMFWIFLTLAINVGIFILLDLRLTPRNCRVVERISYSTTESSRIISASPNSSTSPACRVPDLDPFDPSVTEWFDFEPIPPCPKWESPFLVRPPNRFQMKPDHVMMYQKNCSYNTLEGQKFHAGNEIEAMGPAVTFNAHYGSEQPRI